MMKDRAKSFQLTNPYFSLQLEEGGISSIKPGGAVPGYRDTEFVHPDFLWGRMDATVRKVHTDSLIYEAVVPDEAPSLTHDGRHAMGTVHLKSMDRLLMVAVDHELDDDLCRIDYHIKNTSPETLILEDLRLFFPANTRFDWGKPAGDKVIGHNFISGHGSHIVCERCDGNGPMLIVYPTGGTAFEYFGAEHEDDEERHGGSFYICIHSHEIRKHAVENGARPKQAATSKVLESGEEVSYNVAMSWAENNRQAQQVFADQDLVRVEVLPGMTVPQNEKLRLYLETKWNQPVLTFEDGSVIEPSKQEGEKYWYDIKMPRLGEQILWLRDRRGYQMHLDVFVTEPVETLIQKRAAFLSAHQHTDPDTWYYGLFGEWNNESGVLLGPDNYDKIKGWRIYEVSCDDPGLGKPAFLSGKLAVLPDDEQLRAMDTYVEHFVWGGLQCTEEEPYPYGIYGIPDWKTLRESDKKDTHGTLHLWRIYDYPHIFLMYYNLYRIKKQHPEAPLSQSEKTYLLRAYHTAMAMFTIPMELDEWSAWDTGLYHEYTIEDIIKALDAEGFEFEKQRLERQWDRKVLHFTVKQADIFGSEYPFDTTGFEATYRIAKRALETSAHEIPMHPFSKEIPLERAWALMGQQHKANVSCRGVLEPAYYWYGSDYRSNNTHYTLSYMSQMGGTSILLYGLYDALDPFDDIRLGYGSLLSSWALMNTGTAESGYGYFYPGKEHDGAASGGYEPLYEGETWLQQPHHGGPWYYSCEIDMGYCGYLKGAASVLSEDPVFGMSGLGCDASESDGIWTVIPHDGVQQRFHYIDASHRIHVELDYGRMTKLMVNPISGQIHIQFDLNQIACESHVTVLKEGYNGKQTFQHIATGGLTV